MTAQQNQRNQQRERNKSPPEQSPACNNYSNGALEVFHEIQQLSKAVCKIHTQVDKKQVVESYNCEALVSQNALGRGWVKNSPG